MIGARSWMEAVGRAAQRRRQPWILTGLLIVMLGATWAMQGLDLIDGAFFGNRMVSVVAGIGTACLGVALMVGLVFRRGSAGDASGRS